jgi:hypothetical protein
MMRIVSLNDEIRDRELQLVNPQATALLFGRKAMTSAEKQKDVGRLADDEAPRLQKRRRERRMSDVPTVQKAHERGDSQAFAGPARDVDILGGPLLERESHELTATLDLWPIKKPIRHTATPNAAQSLGNPDRTEPYNE